jgi:hypothetical protein
MEAAAIALFRSDIAAQQVTIERVFALLQQRSVGLTPENPEKLESVAYQLHNFYSAIEELLKLVATYFENNISDAAQWHSLLLKRMTQPVPGIRPAVLCLDSYDALNSLRGFRHFFRHAYGVPIDYIQLQSNLNLAIALKPLLDQDIAHFLAAL